MRRLGFLFSFCLLACGPKVVPRSEIEKVEKKATCPNVRRVPREEITLSLKATPPAKIAIEVDDKRIYSECNQPPNDFLIAHLERLANNQLFVKIEHFDGVAPASIKLALKELVDCGSTEKDILAPTTLALRYDSEFPDGTKCPAQKIDRISLSPN